jgi:hypothetical protein
MMWKLRQREYLRRATARIRPGASLLQGAATCAWVAAATLLQEGRPGPMPWCFEFERAKVVPIPSGYKGGALHSVREVFQVRKKHSGQS